MNEAERIYHAALLLGAGAVGATAFTLNRSTSTREIYTGLGLGAASSADELHLASISVTRLARDVFCAVSIVAGPVRR